MRTKDQIKIDRLMSYFIGCLGLISFGYSVALNDIPIMIISFLAILFLIRVDKCNNDLEYGRYAKEVKK